MRSSCEDAGRVEGGVAPCEPELACGDRGWAGPGTGSEGGAEPGGGRLGGSARGTAPPRLSLRPGRDGGHGGRRLPDAFGVPKIFAE